MYKKNLNNSDLLPHVTSQETKRKLVFVFYFEYTVKQIKTEHKMLWMLLILLKGLANGFQSLVWWRNYELLISMRYRI